MSVIGAYRPQETYKKNHAVMSHSIYQVAVIEKCLNYLKVQTRTKPGNDKIYRNKKLMVDRLILKIESCFPALCDECAVEYSNSVNESPLFTCFICWQGSHNCNALQEHKKECEKLTTTAKALGSVPDGITSNPSNPSWATKFGRATKKLSMQYE